MSHKVETMMYAGQEPWHGIGEKVETEVTSAAAMKLAGLDWEVEKRSLATVSEKTVDGIPVVGLEVPNYKAIVRKSDNKVMSVVQDTYAPIQNSEQFDFMDSLVGEGLAMYHTAGALKGGRQIFMTVKLSGDYRIADHEVEKFLLLTSSHDYSGPMRVLWTPIRVVCWNTLSAALGPGVQRSVSIRHTRYWRNKQNEAREVLGLAEGYYQKLREQMEQMELKKLGEKVLLDVLEELYPINSPRSKAHVMNRRRKVRLLYRDGRGNSGKTTLDAYNAIVEEYDHRKRHDSKWMNAQEHKFIAAAEDRDGFKRRAFNILTTV